MSGSSQPNSISLRDREPIATAVDPLLVLGEVMAVACQEAVDVGRHQVDLASDRLGFARLEPADPEVGVQADDHSLEELLIRLPRRGHDLLAVGREAADQPVRGDDRAERPGLTSSRLTSAGHQTCPGVYRACGPKARSASARACPSRR